MLCQHRRVDIDQSPLGNSASEAAAFVREQIERSLPTGWCVTGLDESGYLDGQISRIGHGHSPHYGVIIPAASDLLIFTWGNSSAGPFRVEQALEQALVIAPMFLRMFGMKACVMRLLELPGNAYDLT
jgi:hypothetical protein